VVVPLSLVDWGWITIGFVVFLLLNVGSAALNSRLFESRSAE